MLFQQFQRMQVTSHALASLTTRNRLVYTHARVYVHFRARTCTQNKYRDRYRYMYRYIYIYIEQSITSHKVPFSRVSELLSTLGLRLKQRSSRVIFTRIFSGSQGCTRPSIIDHRGSLENSPICGLWISQSRSPICYRAFSILFFSFSRSFRRVASKRHQSLQMIVSFFFLLLLLRYNYYCFIFFFFSFSRQSE